MVCNENKSTSTNLLGGKYINGMDGVWVVLCLGGSVCVCVCSKKTAGPTSRPEENTRINYVLFPVEFLAKQNHQHQLVNLSQNSTR